MQFTLLQQPLCLMCKTQVASGHLRKHRSQVGICCYNPGKVKRTTAKSVAVQENNTFENRTHLRDASGIKVNDWIMHWM